MASLCYCKTTVQSVAALTPGLRRVKKASVESNSNSKANSVPSEKERKNINPYVVQNQWFSTGLTLGPRFTLDNSKYQNVVKKEKKKLKMYFYYHELLNPTTCPFVNMQVQLC